MAANGTEYRQFPAFQVAVIQTTRQRARTPIKREIGIIQQGDISKVRADRRGWNPRLSSVLIPTSQDGDIIAWIM